MIDGASFQIASPKEINRVSRLVRLQLGKAQARYQYRNPDV